MVTRLLDIERMEAGLLELEWSKISVDKIVQKSTESVRSLLPRDSFQFGSTS
jgi:K+-sensing histidine kinase KdpD